MSTIIERTYPSLAEAQKRGPGDLYDLARERGWRLVSAATYCERDGLGVQSIEIDGDVIAPAHPTDESPAPVGSEDQPNPDTTEPG